jgi:hypothetical protein
VGSRLSILSTNCYRNYHTKLATNRPIIQLSMETWKGNAVRSKVKYSLLHCYTEKCYFRWQYWTEHAHSFHINHLPQTWTT